MRLFYYIASLLVSLCLCVGCAMEQDCPPPNVTPPPGDSKTIPIKRKRPQKVVIRAPRAFEDFDSIVDGYIVGNIFRMSFNNEVEWCNVAISNPTIGDVREYHFAGPLTHIDIPIDGIIGECEVYITTPSDEYFSVISGHL